MKDLIILVAMSVMLFVGYVAGRTIGFEAGRQEILQSF